MSGRSEAWYRAWFGTRRSQVRILPPRPFISLESLNAVTAEGLVLSAVSLPLRQFYAHPSPSRIACAALPRIARRGSSYYRPSAKWRIRTRMFPPAQAAEFVEDVLAIHESHPPFLYVPTTAFTVAKPPPHAGGKTEQAIKDVHGRLLRPVPKAKTSMDVLADNPMNSRLDKYIHCCIIRRCRVGSQSPGWVTAGPGCKGPRLPFVQTRATNSTWFSAAKCLRILR